MGAHTYPVVRQEVRGWGGAPHILLRGFTRVLLQQGKEERRPSAGKAVLPWESVGDGNTWEQAPAQPEV